MFFSPVFVNISMDDILPLSKVYYLISINSRLDMNAVFRTQPNIYDGAFLRKYLVSQEVSPKAGKHAPE